VCGIMSAAARGDNSESQEDSPEVAGVKTVGEKEARTWAG